jgi:hypothetical protein
VLRAIVRHPGREGEEFKEDVVKLKLHGNSIRVRLTRSEVARFGACGRLEEAFVYGPSPSQQLTYGIESVSSDSVGVRVDQNGIFAQIPASLADEWTTSDRVGVSGEVNHPDGRRIDVLIEKEFRRIHGGNNDPDLYPNPLETCADSVHQ